jgi:hypothetical protein
MHAVTITRKHPMGRVLHRWQFCSRRTGVRLRVLCRRIARAARRYLSYLAAALWGAMFNRGGKNRGSCMESHAEARDTIYRELTSPDAEVRAEFARLFHADINNFCDAMATTVLEWRVIDAMVKDDESLGYVAALTYAAFTLHIVSFKLFLSGHIVAAGNQFRQALETMALALLCSSKELDVLPRFMKDQYSTQNAVRDVLRQWKKLGLKEDGVVALRDGQEFYHRYSHITRLTLATMISFSEEGSYVGASFDQGKIGAYRKEVAGRLGLANVFPNFMIAVRSNLAKWTGA